MKTIFYIGHFKTGSSSLQGYLSANQAALARAGILYPPVESQGVAHLLSSVLRGRKTASVDLPLNILEPHNALALRLMNEENGHEVPPYYPHLPSGFQMIQMVDALVRDLSPDAVIFCSEVFALFGGTPGNKSLQRVKNRLSFGNELITCNLRRPDKHLASWHLQRLKFGSPMNALRGGAMEHYFHGVHFDQFLLLRAWKEQFHAAEFVVQNFDDIHDTVANFKTLSGITCPDDNSRSLNLNPSVPYAFAEICRLALVQAPGAISGYLVNWVASNADRLEFPKNPDVDLFGKDLRNEMVERFRPIHHDLSRLVGVDEFYPDLDEIRDVPPLSDIDAARMALPGLIDRLNRQSHVPDGVLGWLNDLDLEARSSREPA